MTDRFPILGSRGASIALQLVEDPGKQAQANHYQSVGQLARRGGLSWSELYAVLHNRPYARVDENEAIVACRALETKYLGALSRSASSEITDRLIGYVRRNASFPHGGVIDDERGEQWSAMILEARSLIRALDAPVNRVSQAPQQEGESE